MRRNQVGIRLDLRGTDRAKQLVWELRQLERDLRLAGLPEADRLARILERFFADVDEDRPAD